MTWSVHRSQQIEEHRQQEDWGCLRWAASAAHGGSRCTTVLRVHIRSGCSNPRHSHANCEEVLYLLKGRLEHEMGGETVILEPGDALIVGPGVPHHATCISEEDADMIVAYPVGKREFTPHD